MSAEKPISSGRRSTSSLVREASDPTTTPARLFEMLTMEEHATRSILRRYVLGNPNLDPAVLRGYLTSRLIYEEAWFNPTTQLLLLAGPDQELMASAISLFIYPSTYSPYAYGRSPPKRFYEPIETTRAALMRHLRRCLIELPTYKETLAGRVAELFGITREQLKASP